MDRQDARHGSVVETSAKVGLNSGYIVITGGSDRKRTSTFAHVTLSHPFPYYIFCLFVSTIHETGSSV